MLVEIDTTRIYRSESWFAEDRRLYFHNKVKDLFFLILSSRNALFMNPKTLDLDFIQWIGVWIHFWILVRK